jgi:Protein of unknown function (DUF2971)
MRIYKYCDAKGVDVLKNLRLKVTPLNAFNDIFEFTPTAVGASAVKWADARQIPKHAKEILERLAARGKKFMGSEEDFRKLIEKEAKTPVFASADQMAAMCRDIVDHISKTHGLICFSKRRNNLLMWSHYADGHKGLVIGFDIVPRLMPEKPPFDVEYHTRRLPWKFGLNSSKAEMASEIQKLIQRKSIHWRYEKEVRILWALEGLTREIDDQQRVSYFTRIPSEIISEVILGYRCDRNPDLESSVRRWIKENNLRVQLNRAETSESRFGLRFKPA